MPLAARLGHRLALAAAAGLAPGLYEAFETARHATSAGGALLHAVFAWSLWVFGAVLALSPWILGGLSPWRPSGEPGSVERPPPAAWFIAGLLALGLAAVLGLEAFALLEKQIAPRNVPAAGTVTTVALAGLLLLLTPALASGLSSLSRGRKLPRAILPILSALAGLGAALAVDRVAGRYTAAPLALVGALAVLLPSAGRRILGLAPLVAVLGLTVTIYVARDGRPAAVRGPSSFGLLPSLAFQSLDGLSDSDDDGYGDAWGGRDCDDDNPRIHPATLDVPENGVDENCSGRDASGQFERPSLPPPKTPLTFGTLAERPHVILLVLDAWRADHLGDRRGLTKNLDALAERGTRFSRMQSPGSSTRFAIPALMTGRWTSHTDYRETVNGYNLDKKVRSLAEVFQASGYETLAVVPAFLQQRLKGLERGFSEFVRIDSVRAAKSEAGRSAPMTVEQCLRFLRGRHQAPLFLYAHLDDPHAPYTTNDAPLTFGDAPIERYAAEIARLDRDLEPLLARILELEKERPVLLVVTSDHGEAFGEHGSKDHGRDLYQPALHVPLFLVGPGVTPALTLDAPVDHLDLAVTLADVAGGALPTAEGQSLWGLLQGEPATTARPLFSEVRVLHAPYPSFGSVLLWPHKLILRVDTDERQLFDLATDPGETRDLFQDEPDIARRLEAELTAWIELGYGPGGQFTAP